jgi:hypothetical protein
MERARIRAAEWYRANKTRHKIYRDRYYQENKARLLAKAQDARRRRDYGLSRAEFEAMLRRQDGRCAICRKPERRKLYGKVSDLSVDHDHLMGQVRGLLCFDCNTSIGKLGDAPGVRAALTYLERYATKAA